MKNMLNLRKERLKNGWTLNYVASEIGITNQAINLLETGQNEPSYSTLCKLEILFNKTHNYLFSIIQNDIQYLEN